MSEVSTYVDFELSNALVTSAIFGTIMAVVAAFATVFFLSESNWRKRRMDRMLALIATAMCFGSVMLVANVIVQDSRLTEEKKETLYTLISEEFPQAVLADEDNVTVKQIVDDFSPANGADATILSTGVLNLETNSETNETVITFHEFKESSDS